MPRRRSQGKLCEEVTAEGQIKRLKRLNGKIETFELLQWRDSRSRSKEEDNAEQSGFGPKK